MLSTSFKFLSYNCADRKQKFPGSGFESSCSHFTSDFAPASSKEFLDIQATIECGFALKRVRDMTRTYSQIKKSFRKYGYDNNHNLEPVGLLKDIVLQVFSSWENQIVLQIFKHNKKNCFTFNIF